MQGRGWNKKTPDCCWNQRHRKVGIRPFNDGQSTLATGSVVFASVCQASLNGRFPTFRFLRVERRASGVYFFQGWSRSYADGRGGVVPQALPEARPHASWGPLHLRAIYGFDCVPHGNPRARHHILVCDLAFFYSIQGCHMWHVASRARQIQPYDLLFVVSPRQNYHKRQNRKAANPTLRFVFCRFAEAKRPKTTKS